MTATGRKQPVAALLKQTFERHVSGKADSQPNLKSITPAASIALKAAVDVQEI